MRISLDYDFTYTQDPELWDEFIASAKKRGHEVVCVTMRSRDEAQEIIDKFGDDVPVHCTNRIAKVPFMNHMGIPINIWIDDSPEWLLNNALYER